MSFITKNSQIQVCRSTRYFSIFRYVFQLNLSETVGPQKRTTRQRQQLICAHNLSLARCGLRIAVPSTANLRDAKKPKKERSKKEQALRKQRGVATIVNQNQLRQIYPTKNQETRAMQTTVSSVFQHAQGHWVLRVHHSHSHSIHALLHTVLQAHLHHVNGQLITVV